MIETAAFWLFVAIGFIGILVYGQSHQTHDAVYAALFLLLSLCLK